MSTTIGMEVTAPEAGQAPTIKLASVEPMPASVRGPMTSPAKVIGNWQCIPVIAGELIHHPFEIQGLKRRVLLSRVSCIRDEAVSARRLFDAARGASTTTTQMEKEALAADHGGLLIVGRMLARPYFSYDNDGLTSFVTQLDSAYDYFIGKVKTGLQRMSAAQGSASSSGERPPGSDENDVDMNASSCGPDSQSTSSTQAT